MKAIELKFKSLANICDDINSITKKISNGEITFFSHISIQVKFRDAELCFHTIIPWLYILYHEASERNINFIQKKIISYNIPITDNAKESQKIIHSFRTLLQHLMDFENSASDIAKKNFCEFWCRSLIGKENPTNEEEWKVCLNALLNSVIDFLQSIYSCLKAISTNEHIELVIGDWKKLISRSYSVYDFEKVLQKVLTNHGLSEYFDANSVTKKNIEIWRKELDVLPDGFDFEIHAYKIIERFVLKKEILPIDGNDLLELGVEKGKKIPELLLKAKTDFYHSPCNKEELLNRIKTLI